MMDFALAERQQAVADLAAQVLAGADPWKELAQAGLLDVSQLGVLDAAVLLTEIGRHAPSLQALATLMTGALPVARWGTPPSSASCCRESRRASFSSPPPSASPPTPPPPLPPQQSQTEQSPAPK